MDKRNNKSLARKKERVTSREKRGVYLDSIGMKDLKVQVPLSLADSLKRMADFNAEPVAALIRRDLIKLARLNDPDFDPYELRKTS